MEFYIGLGGEKINNRVSPLFKGVGLIRPEYICRTRKQYITHPDCFQAIKKYVSQVVSLFAPDPVWYRFFEMETSEANIMEGVDHLYHEYNNTLVGLRALRRAQKFPEPFYKEAEMITKLSHKYSNLGVVLPFINDVRELIFAKRILKEVGYKSRLGMMAEIPAAVICLDKFLSEGVDYVILGMNDLTCLTLGIRRVSQDEGFLHPSLKRLIHQAQDYAFGFQAELAVAGYIDNSVFKYVESVGIKIGIVHYSFMAPVFGQEWANIPNRINIEKLKNEVRHLVDDYSRQIPFAEKLE